MSLVNNIDAIFDLYSRNNSRDNQKATPRKPLLVFFPQALLPTFSHTVFLYGARKSGEWSLGMRLSLCNKLVLTCMYIPPALCDPYSKGINLLYVHVCALFDLAMI